MAFLGGFHRKKTVSESSDNADEHYLYDIDGKYAYSYYKKPVAKQSSYASDGEGSLSLGGVVSAASGNVLYDLDGKFNYTVFDPKLHFKGKKSE